MALMLNEHLVLDTVDYIVGSYDFNQKAAKLEEGLHRNRMHFGPNRINIKPFILGMTSIVFACGAAKRNNIDDFFISNQPNQLMMAALYKTDTENTPAKLRMINIQPNMEHASLNIGKD